MKWISLKEGILWIIALIGLFLIDPASGESHFTLCPLANAGLEWCPGCGIGHSIGLMLHGEVHKAWEAHVFGPVAVVLILIRIITIIKLNSKQLTFKNHE